MSVTRREFLKRTGAAIAGTGAGRLLADCASAEEIRGEPRRVVIVLDPTDTVANTKPVQWALGEFRESLAAGQIATPVVGRVADADVASHRVLVAGTTQPIAQAILSGARVNEPRGPESLALVQGRVGAHSVLLVCGYHPRGLTYALLELADRVTHAKHPLEGLALPRPISETPANQVRSNMRLFASDIEDKSWFYDRAFWRSYLSMLAKARFNRFNLALGLGYDFTSGIKDAYFHFAYPFLVPVPGYDVRVTRLADGERERNLEMLRFISDETAARGLDFQLGLWTHAYRWTNSPGANHTIEGLTPQNHAAYCQDALHELLTACPAIGGVTFRIHGESGVAEGSYDFWKTVFEGLTRCGRPVGLDMHAKGIDADMIEVALATGLPVTVSPKFWAEHMGLPYHQTGIRATEKPPPGKKDDGFFSKSSGSRSFMRYGYGDLLVEGRRYDIVYRIWPGTQRLLLWGDPVLAAGYGRAAGFCGSNGLELFEPLSFKGRKGSGLPGGRDAYADESLKPARDFEKYAYGYRLWGRLLYNPDASPEVWRRPLVNQYGRAAGPVEIALGSSSRILPLITTAHLPSAANNNYWPEIYTNMPIVDPNRKHPYGDTPNPKRCGTVSPLDPQLFSRVDDFADELLSGNFSGKYSPMEVADWLLDLATTATRALSQARRLAPDSGAPSFRRLAVDVDIQIDLGRFFAQKLRAGVFYALFELTLDKKFLEQALAAYCAGRRIWSELATKAAGVYVSDITFGLDPHLRGHWQDRIPAMDQDIADMEQRLAVNLIAAASAANGDVFDRVMKAMLAKPKSPRLSVRHEPPASYYRGQPLKISLTLSHGSAGAARIFYRHINQAEEFQSAEMTPAVGTFEWHIPGAYTDSPFPLQYYFELRAPQQRPWIYPGLGPNLNQQPYCVVRAG